MLPCETFFFQSWKKSYTKIDIMGNFSFSIFGSLMSKEITIMYFLHSWAVMAREITLDFYGVFCQ